MDALSNLLGRQGFLPHGYCFNWSPGVLWSMVASDALITLAYFSIPLTLASFVRRRPDITHRHIVLLFGAFIFACGVTHALDVWTLWQPDYALQAGTKAVTAAISVLTAFSLWRLIPKALAIPSVTQLHAVIHSLEAEVARRRTAEEHLAETELSLAVTLAAMGAGFMATDRSGRVTRMNRVAEQILGWTQAEALGHSIWAVFQREGRAAELLQRNPLDVMIERGVTIEQAQQVVAVSRDGRRTELEVKADVTRDESGAIRGMALVMRDLTQALQAAATESRLAAIVESSNDAIIGKTLDGRITSWNPAATVTFGYTAEEAIGQPVQMLIPADRLDEEMRILTALARGQRVPALDTVRRRRDGSLVEVSVSISPIRDSQGRITGASKIVTDITQRRLTQQARQLAEQLESENRQIQQANRLKSQFLANMSHELRTPLNAVIGFAELLKSGSVPHDSPKRNQFLGHIAVSGRHLLQLINDVLDLSKVDSGKFEFHPEALDLVPLLHEVLDLQQQGIQHKRLSTTLVVDPELGTLHLDPARLKQALLNFVSNAIKFTPEGGRIEVRALADGPDRFRVEVEDTGIGIASQDLPRLFSEFQQLDSGLSKQHAGTGLGLALTRRLVEAQGGQVGVRSTPGVGSVFHLVLDRHVRFAPAHPATALPAATEHLLVVEDHEGHRRWLTQSFTEAGARVDAASNGAGALALAQQRAYSGLTLDLVLPDETGLSLLARIRGGGLSKETPVLGLSMPSGSGVPAGVVVSDVLSKPIRTQEVVLAMSRLRARVGRPLQVMVVDDDPLALDLMSATLAGLGVTVHCVDQASTAWDSLEQVQPDAIVLDLMMPGMDGFEALDLLRRMPRWQTTPVFIWTSLLLTDDELTRLMRSADAILVKGGGSLQALIDAVRQGGQVRIGGH
jgi:PAS domain S-box-containing protein